jgi:hypothetical protein
MSIALTEVVIATDIQQSEKDKRLLRMASELMYISMEKDPVEKLPSGGKRFQIALREAGFDISKGTNLVPIIASLRAYLKIEDGVSGDYDDFIRALSIWGNLPEAQEFKIK